MTPDALSQRSETLADKCWASGLGQSLAGEVAALEAERDRYRLALEAVQKELLDTGDGDWLPGTSRAHKLLEEALRDEQ